MARNSLSRTCFGKAISEPSNHEKKSTPSYRDACAEKATLLLAMMGSLLQPLRSQPNQFILLSEIPISNGDACSQSLYI